MARFLAKLGLFVVPALFVLAGSLSSAQAQDRPAARRPRVVVLPMQVVHGRVQEPGAFYIVQRSRPAPDERDLRTGLLREVARTVQRSPF